MHELHSPLDALYAGKLWGFAGAATCIDVQCSLIELLSRALQVPRAATFVGVRKSNHYVEEPNAHETYSVEHLASCALIAFLKDHVPISIPSPFKSWQDPIAHGTVGSIEVSVTLVCK